MLQTFTKTIPLNLLVLLSTFVFSGFYTPIDAQQTNCDESRLPIILCHGFLGSGDTYANQFMRFTANGYCADRLFVFDWNSLGMEDNTALLDTFIDEVLAATNAEQVDLGGHSAGGGLGYDYLADPIRAAKVAHYVHIGSFPNDAPAGASGEVATLNIWSVDDLVVTGADIPGATNAMLTGADHYEVATNAEAFEAMFTFFNEGIAPTITGIVAEETVLVSGKALTFGLNTPEVGATIEIYETDPTTGYRLNATPDATFTADANGHWGPFEAVPYATYEFFTLSATPDARPLHYYREGFFRSNQLVYLRTLPPPTTLAGILLSGLPQDDEQALVVLFSANQAVISGRDELLINDSVELSSDMWASADQTTIAYFLYDDGDYTTEETSLGLFGSFPFLNGVDVFFPTDPPASIHLEMNGHELSIPNWQSGTDGAAVVVFDLLEADEDVGVDAPLFTEEIQVFPNPFEEAIHVLLPNKAAAFVELYNLQGQLLFSQMADRQDFVLGGEGLTLADGVYLVKVVQGGEVFFKKVVKK